MKLDAHLFFEHRTESDEALDKIRVKHQELVNEVKTLDNWIEKYEPLRTQNQVSQTLSAILTGKEKKRLTDYDDMLFTKLYDVVLLDDGRPDIVKRTRRFLIAIVMRGVNEEIESMVEGIKRRQTARKAKVQGISPFIMPSQRLRRPKSCASLASRSACTTRWRSSSQSSVRRATRAAWTATKRGAATRAQPTSPR